MSWTWPRTRPLLLRTRKQLGPLQCMWLRTSATPQLLHSSVLFEMFYNVFLSAHRYACVVENGPAHVTHVLDTHQVQLKCVTCNMITESDNPFKVNVSVITLVCFHSPGFPAIILASPAETHGAANCVASCYALATMCVYCQLPKGGRQTDRGGRCVQTVGHYWSSTDCEGSVRSVPTIISRQWPNYRNYGNCCVWSASQLWPKKAGCFRLWSNRRWLPLTLHQFYCGNCAFPMKRLDGAERVSYFVLAVARRLGPVLDLLSYLVTGSIWADWDMTPHVFRVARLHCACVHIYGKDVLSKTTRIVFQRRLSCT